MEPLDPYFNRQLFQRNAGVINHIQPLNFNQRLFFMVNRTVERTDTQLLKLTLKTFFENVKNLSAEQRRSAEKDIEKLIEKFPVPTENIVPAKNLKIEKELFLDELVKNNYAVFARKRLSILANEARSPIEKNLYLAELLENASQRMALIQNRVFLRPSQYQNSTLQQFRDEYSLIIKNTSEYLQDHLKHSSESFFVPQNSIEQYLKSLAKLVSRTKAFIEIFPADSIFGSLYKTQLNQGLRSLQDKILESPTLSLKQVLPLYSAESPDLTMKFLNKFNPEELINEYPVLNKERLDFIHEEIKAFRGLATTSSSISPSQSEKETMKNMQSLLAAKLIDLMPYLETSKNIYLDLLDTLKEKAPLVRDSMQDSKIAKTFSEIKIFMKHDDSLLRFFNSHKKQYYNSLDQSTASNLKASNFQIKQHEYRDFLDRLGSYADKGLRDQLIPEYLTLIERSHSLTSLKENLKSLNSFIANSFHRDEILSVKDDLHASLVKILEPILNSYDENYLGTIYSTDKKELVKQLEKLNLEKLFKRSY